MLIIYLVIALCTVGMNGEKAKMHVFIEDVEVNVINPEYFDPETTERFVTEERTVGTNWTILKKFPPETISTIESIGYSMGVYNIPTVKKMHWTFCEFIGNVMAKEYFTLMGIVSDSCPPEPGNYFLDSHLPSSDNLPSGIPDNRYVMTTEIALEGKTLYKDQIYLETQTY